MVLSAIRMQILHLMLFKRGLIYGVGGTKLVFEGISGTQITQLCLDHCAKVSRRVVTKFDHFAKFAIEKNYHAASDLCCRNRHRGSCSSVIEISPGSKHGPAGTETPHKALTNPQV